MVTDKKTTEIGEMLNSEELNEKAKESINGMLPKWEPAPNMTEPPEKLGDFIIKYFKRLGDIREEVLCSDYSERRRMKYNGYKRVLEDMLRENGGYIDLYDSISKSGYKSPKRNTSLAKYNNLDSFFGGEYGVDLDSDIRLKEQIEWHLLTNETVVGEIYEKDYLWVIELFHLLCKHLESEINELEYTLTSVNKISLDEKTLNFETATNEKSAVASSGNNNNNTGLKEQMKTLDHIMIDDNKAKKLYRALSNEQVGWLIEPHEETEFVNILTLPPSGKRIKLKQLCQVRYITKGYLFTPKEGNNTRKVTQKEWELIAQIFDTEKGDVHKAQCSNKKPVNSKKLDYLMR